MSFASSLSDAELALSPASTRPTIRLLLGRDLTYLSGFAALLARKRHRVVDERTGDGSIGQFQDQAAFPAWHTPPTTQSASTSGHQQPGSDCLFIIEDVQ